MDKNIQMPKTLAWVIIGALLGIAGGAVWSNIDLRFKHVTDKNAEQDVVIVQNQKNISSTLEDLGGLAMRFFRLKRSGKNDARY